MGSEQEEDVDFNEGWGNPLFDDAFLMEHKAEYVKKPKNVATQTESDCIICSIVRREEGIERREIYRNEVVIVFLNIHPYTAGHILVSPLTHYTGFEELSMSELRAFSIMVQRVIEMLKHFGHTESLNAGWNQGSFAGGSIAHFHMHVVPRYKNDINFVDVIARSRPILYSLEKVENELRKYQPFLAGEKEIDNLIDLGMD